MPDFGTGPDFWTPDTPLPGGAGLQPMQPQGPQVPEVDPNAGTEQALEQFVRTQIPRTVESRAKEKMDEYLQKTFGIEPGTKGNKKQRVAKTLVNIFSSLGGQNPEMVMRRQAQQDMRSEHPFVQTGVTELRNADLSKKAYEDRQARTQMAQEKLDAQNAWKEAEQKNQGRKREIEAMIAAGKVNQLEGARLKAEADAEYSTARSEVIRKTLGLKGDHGLAAAMASGIDPEADRTETMFDRLQKSRQKHKPLSTPNAIPWFGVKHHDDFVASPDDPNPRARRSVVGIPKSDPTRMEEISQDGEMQPGEIRLSAKEAEELRRVNIALEQGKTSTSTILGELARVAKDPKNKFLGPMAGNPFSQWYRAKFGNLTPAEAASKMFATNALYTHMKTLSSGRPSDKQLDMIDQSMQQASSQPEAFFASQFMQVLSVDLMRQARLGGVDENSINPNTMASVSRLTSGLLNAAKKGIALDLPSSQDMKALAAGKTTDVEILRNLKIKEAKRRGIIQ